MIGRACIVCYFRAFRRAMKKPLSFFAVFASISLSFIAYLFFYKSDFLGLQENSHPFFGIGDKPTGNDRFFRPHNYFKHDTKFSSKALISREKCRIPDFPLWNKDAVEEKENYRDLSVYNCSKKKPRLTYLDRDELVIDMGVMERLRLNLSEVSCCYRNIWREETAPDQKEYDEIADKLYKFSKCKTLTNYRTKIDSMFIVVHCVSPDYLLRPLQYHNFHAVPLLMPSSNAMDGYRAENIERIERKLGKNINMTALYIMNVKRAKGKSEDGGRGKTDEDNDIKRASRPKKPDFDGEDEEEDIGSDRNKKVGESSPEKGKNKPQVQDQQSEKKKNEDKEGIKRTNRPTTKKPNYDEDDEEEDTESDGNKKSEDSSQKKGRNKPQVDQHSEKKNVPNAFPKTTIRPAKEDDNDRDLIEVQPKWKEGSSVGRSGSGVKDEQERIPKTEKKKFPRTFKLSPKISSTTKKPNYDEDDDEDDMRDGKESKGTSGRKEKTKSPVNVQIENKNVQKRLRTTTRPSDDEYENDEDDESIAKKKFGTTKSSLKFNNQKSQVGGGSGGKKSGESSLNQEKNKVPVKFQGPGWNFPVPEDKENDKPSTKSPPKPVKLGMSKFKFRKDQRPVEQNAENSMKEDNEENDNYNLPKEPPAKLGMPKFKFRKDPVKLGMPKFKFKKDPSPAGQNAEENSMKNEVIQGAMKSYKKASNRDIESNSNPLPTSRKPSVSSYDDDEDDNEYDENFLKDARKKQNSKKENEAKAKVTEKPIRKTQKPIFDDEDEDDEDMGAENKIQTRGKRQKRSVEKDEGVGAESQHQARGKRRKRSVVKKDMSRDEFRPGRKSRFGENTLNEGNRGDGEDVKDEVDDKEWMSSSKKIVDGGGIDNGQERMFPSNNVARGKYQDWNERNRRYSKGEVGSLSEEDIDQLNKPVFNYVKISNKSQGLRKPQFGGRGGQEFGRFPSNMDSNSNQNGRGNMLPTYDSGRGNRLPTYDSDMMNKLGNVDISNVNVPQRLEKPPNANVDSDPVPKYNRDRDPELTKENQKEGNIKMSQRSPVREPESINENRKGEMINMPQRSSVRDPESINENRDAGHININMPQRLPKRKLPMGKPRSLKSPSQVEETKMNFPKRPPTMPHILIIGIESTSRVNFRRFMKQSLKALKYVGAVEMKGFTKVGPNKLSNILPLLTSYSLNEINHLCRRNNSKRAPLDKCPFVWKDFARQGYLTAHLEDDPHLNSFRFAGKHVDFNMKPFMMAAYAHHQGRRLDHGNSIDCIGYERPEEIVLKFTQKLIRSATNNWNRPTFTFTWLTDLTHRKSNSIKMMDAQLSRIIMGLYYEKILNNTLLIMMSDHGYRFDPFRRTLSGWYEDKLPVLWIRAPSVVEDEEDRFVEALIHNSKQLITPFDLHATLKHILKKNRRDFGVPISSPLDEDQDQNQVQPSASRRGISLFTKIPARSCTEAGIPSGHCPCNMKTDYDISSRLVSKAVEVANRYLNQRLPDSCLSLKLRKLLGTAVLVHPKNMNTFKEEKELMNKDILIVLAVAKPGEMIVEIGVVYDKRLNAFNSTGHLVRTNRIDDQGNCISRVHPMYDFCKCEVKIDFKKEQKLLIPRNSNGDRYTE